MFIICCFLQMNIIRYNTQNNNIKYSNLKNNVSTKNPDLWTIGVVFLCIVWTFSNYFLVWHIFVRILKCPCTAHMLNVRLPAVINDNDSDTYQNQRCQIGQVEEGFSQKHCRKQRAENRNCKAENCNSAYSVML